MNIALSGRTVLIVEDEMIFGWLLKDILTDLGCIVIGPAARVDEALRMIETAKILDIVVLDINLHRQRSYPVADALIARGIPFVFSTGYNKYSLPEIYKNFAMLQKPFKSQELADALMKLLAGEEKRLTGQ